jgi:hypothetical protein
MLREKKYKESSADSKEINIVEIRFKKKQPDKPQEKKLFKRKIKEAAKKLYEVTILKSISKSQVLEVGLKKNQKF